MRLSSQSQIAVAKFDGGLKHLKDVLRPVVKDKDMVFMHLLQCVSFEVLLEQKMQYFNYLTRTIYLNLFFS